MMGAVLVIERPGLFSTLQDAGRHGYQSFGISASGAMDSVAMQIANTLVGNAPGTAVLELTALGLSARLEGGPACLALCGADMPLTVNGRPAESWRSHALTEGDRIEIGAARNGMRACLALAGGFDIAPTLGSLSTHSRSGIGGYGGRALQAGDRLPLTGATASPPLELPRECRPTWSGPIRVVLGPQDDHFTADSIATLLSADYRISDRADRMGAQLDGPALSHKGGFNIVSDGVMNGSIQVPGHGRPIILLADRQTTGGYPKIATVIGPDLPVVGQKRPGEVMRFVRVSPMEAADAARAHAEAVGAMIAALRPPVEAPGLPSTERLLALNLVGGVCSALSPAAETEAP